MSKYIHLAREMAVVKDAHPNQYTLCAVAFDRNDNVLSVGYNSYSKTHPLQAHYANRAKQPYKVFLHAEIAALVKARADVYRLAVVRVNKEGMLRPANPCPVCELAIVEAGVKIVEHS